VTVSVLGKWLQFTYTRFQNRPTLNKLDTIIRGSYFFQQNKQKLATFTTSA